MLVCGLLSTSQGATWYVAPTGLDANSGTIGSPFETIMRAQTAASSGDTVYLRGGTYFLDNSHLTYTNNPWTAVNRFTKNGVSYLAYPGERPVFDFTDVKPIGNPGYRVTAFLVNSDDCVFKGFDIVGVQVVVTNNSPGVNNTQSECFRIDNGDRNLFEQLTMHDGMGIGWYLVRGQSNLVLNCDAYNNRGLDNLSDGNVDGFGIHGNNVAHTGNVFRGCRAWFNSDDGFDLINCHAPAVIENCWAFYNGYYTNFALARDGNGFKSGGYGVGGASYPIPVPRHVTRFCLAVGNKANGFYANHHTGGLDWINNTAFRNRSANFNMLCNLDANGFDHDVDGFDHYMRNNLGLNLTNVVNLGPSNDVAFNHFTLPVAVATNDFMSLLESLLTAPRKPNGDLPYIAFAQLLGNSDLIDAGTNVGFAYVGGAPDLGAFERGIEPDPTLTLTKNGGNLEFSSTGGPAGGTNLLVASSNATLPTASWAMVATNVYDLTGNFGFTNSVPAGAQEFFRVKLP